MRLLKQLLAFAFVLSVSLSSAALKRRSLKWYQNAASRRRAQTQTVPTPTGGWKSSILLSSSAKTPGTGLALSNVTDALIQIGSNMVTFPNQPLTRFRANLLADKSIELTTDCLTAGPYLQAFWPNVPTTTFPNPGSTAYTTMVPSVSTAAGTGFQAMSPVQTCTLGSACNVFVFGQDLAHPGNPNYAASGAYTDQAALFGPVTLPTAASQNLPGSFGTSQSYNAYPMGSDTTCGTAAKLVGTLNATSSPGMFAAQKMAIAIAAGDFNAGQMGDNVGRTDPTLEMFTIPSAFSTTGGPLVGTGFGAGTYILCWLHGWMYNATGNSPNTVSANMFRIPAALVTFSAAAAAASPAAGPSVAVASMTAATTIGRNKWICFRGNDCLITLTGTFASGVTPAVRLYNWGFTAPLGNGCPAPGATSTAPAAALTFLVLTSPCYRVPVPLSEPSRSP